MDASASSTALPIVVTAVCLACAFTASEGAAQSVTVLSSGNDARSCSTLADQASNHLFLPLDALDTCTRALEYGTLRQHDRAATLVNRGIVQVALRQYQQALQDYTAAMKLEPTLPEAYVSRGNLWFLAENYDKAIADYDQALSLNLGRAHIAYYNRGLAHERKGNRESALSDYRQASQLQPAWPLPQEKISGLDEMPPLSPPSAR
jgi:tetratricopeptide (TPR) repeat protein